MIDKEAITKLQAGAAIEQANLAMPSDLDHCIALPEEFSVHDLEKQFKYRRRARGQYQTPYIASLCEYISTHAESGATVFVDPARMQAQAVLNLGSPDLPGHADNLANLALTRTAAYTALQSVANGAGQKQQTIAEFLEDWVGSIQCFNEAGTIAAPRAVAAVRKITVEALRKQESEEQSLSATRGVLESVSASSTEPLPTTIYFKCQPYAELTERNFVLRLGILTGDKAPAITLRVIKPEEHAEQMAQELVQLISAGLPRDEEPIPVVIGSYAPKA